jgi:alpha-tubulin suppressor-like RCC1 family protein
MTTQITANNIANFTISSLQIANTVVTSVGSPKITSIAIADASYNVLDDTSANTGGGYIVITGTNFVSGATVLVDTTSASAVTVVNSTTIRAQVPAKAAASYNIWVINPDGGTCIKVNGLSYSPFPIWVTTSPLTSQVSNVAFGITFSATGANTYSVAAGSTLPAGTTLAANGYFSGTVSIGVQTDYTFTIKTTDTELQDVDKTFTVTVTVVPPVVVYAWGNNGGSLGLNDTDTKTSPVQLSSSPNWSILSNGGSINFMAAIKTNNTLWGWGVNQYGQLGLNDRVYRSSPVQIGTDANWNQVSPGIASVVAIKNDGTLWAWGLNTTGQLGLNDRVTRSSPVQVGTGTTWSRVSCGPSTTGANWVHALKTDGTLWAWGDQGAYPSLGTNDTVTRSSPVQIGSGTTWSQIADGTRGSAAIKTDGTLWLWGNNQYGQLGQGSTSVTVNSPTQIGALTNWSAVDIGNSGVIATKTNGTLWMWGGNYRNFGMLGNNRGDSTTYGNASSPAQIGSDTNWSQFSTGITTGYRASAAIKTNGTLWVWGYNPGGVLSTGNTTNFSSPVQVGSLTSWTKISMSKSSTPRLFGFAS